MEQHQIGGVVANAPALSGYLGEASLKHFDGLQAILKDAGLPFTQEAALAKLFCTEAASRAADVAIQIHGAIGVSQEFHVERLYRDARAYRILDGTSDIQRLMIASRVQRAGIGEALAPGGLV